MKAIFKTLALFSLVLFLAGCAHNTGKTSDRLSFNALPMHLCGIAEYEGESYYCVIDKNENAFSVSFSGEEKLGGYRFTAEGDNWYISYADSKFPSEKPYADSLVYKLYLFANLAESDFVSENDKSMEFCKENFTFSLRYDNEGRICEMKCDNIKFTPERIQNE